MNHSQFLVDGNMMRISHPNNKKLNMSEVKITSVKLLVKTILVKIILYNAKIIFTLKKNNSIV